MAKYIPLTYPLKQFIKNKPYRIYFMSTVEPTVIYLIRSGDKYYTGNYYSGFSDNFLHAEIYRDKKSLQRYAKSQRTTWQKEFDDLPTWNANSADYRFKIGQRLHDWLAAEIFEYAIVEHEITKF
jgi:hypothetical protein